MDVRVRSFVLFPVLGVALLVAPRLVRAQPGEDPLPDNPAPSSAAQIRSDVAHNDAAGEREVSWRGLPVDFLNDQKHIWLFPTQLARGRHWLPAVVVVGTTAGLIYADPHISRHFQNPSHSLDKVNDVFDPMISTAEVIAIPAALMGVGYVRHDPYQVQTALLSAEAYGDSAIVDLAVKAITRRQRPSDIPPGGDFNNTFFNGGKSPFKGSSFPSGHAAGAFSVATVVAGRYHNHRWVPWAVYGMATAISFSRVTSSAHFTSDVFLGAALGYTITKYQVLRPR